jgi:hypothetical protein
VKGHGIRLLGLGGALICAATVSACTGDAGSEHASTAPSPAVTRWWSAGAQPAGTTIDPKDPTAGARALHRSRSDYCAMLRDTLAAGGSILPSTAGAAGPAARTATVAFVAAIQHVAPAAVATQWQLVGDALVAFVRSDGKSTGKASSAQIGRAAATISTDAQTHCGVDLTAATGQAEASTRP